jgi:hypothetical protein
VKLPVKSVRRRTSQINSRDSSEAVGKIKRRRKMIRFATLVRGMGLTVDCVWDAKGGRDDKDDECRGDEYGCWYVGESTVWEGCVEGFCEWWVAYLSFHWTETCVEEIVPSKMIMRLTFRLREMDQLDHTRAAREEALNSLEAYIYRSRDFLDDELFQKVSSEDERKTFKEKLSAASEWLFSSDSSTLEDFKSKLTELTYLHPLK